MTHTGFYSFGGFFLVARYDLFSSGGEIADNLTRINAGAGWVLRENCELWFEHQLNSEDKDAPLLQVVVGF